MTITANKKWAALFVLWTLHGIIALWQILSLPSDDVFSLQRILMNGLLFTWIIFCLVLCFSILRGFPWLLNILDLVKSPNVRDVISAAAIFTVMAWMEIIVLRKLLESAGNFKYSAYADRLGPFLNLITLVLLEAITLILFFMFQHWAEYKKTIQFFIGRMFLILGPIALLSFFVYSTGWGVVSGYKGDWSRGIPAVAFLEWQIILACIFCAAVVVLESKQKISEYKKLDALICALVWLAAASLWGSQSVAPNSSALAPREPNFEVYPFIDAQVYDQFSQSVLIGNGYGDHEIPQRPLYIILLVLMHVVAGQNYDNVIALQSLLLAFFPVFLYLFGREFFGRPVGVAIALLAILRDYTSNIAAPFTGNLSYSKLYLAELPTAILLVIFLWLGIRWIKSGFPAFSGFMLGGILGIGILIRTQVVVAFPVLIFFALLTRPKLFLPMLKSAALAVVAVMIVVAPWFARNWQMTGNLIFDNPSSQTANLALRYSRVNGEEVNIMNLPGETSVEYNNRMVATARNAFAINPRGVGREIASAFINHGINNILLLPLRYDLKNFGELWTPTNAFWQKWHGALNLSQSLLLGFYVFLFGLGITAAWQRLGWLGFLPLGVNLAYNLWTSIALLSGQRFMLTMDWSAYLYYMIGLFALLSAFLFILERGRGMIGKWYAENQFTFVESAERANWRSYLFAGVFFLGVGSSLWLVEMAFPKRYPLISRDEVIHKIISSSSFVHSKLDMACFQKAADENKLRLVQGRALYPRYYWADDGEVFTDADGYKVINEGRLVFEMVGQASSRVVFPIAEPVDFFPNASDVTLGFDQTGKPWFVLVEHGKSQRLYFSDWFDSSICR